MSMGLATVSAEEEGSGWNAVIQTWVSFKQGAVLFDTLIGQWVRFTFGLTDPQRPSLDRPIHQSIAEWANRISNHGQHLLTVDTTRALISSSRRL